MKKKELENLYAKEISRTTTDLFCTIISTLFALSMFIIACCFWDRDKFITKYSHYFGDDIKSMCNSGEFLFYENPDNLSQHRCLKSCPVVYSNSNGVCLPIRDEDRHRYLDNPDISVLVFGQYFFKVILATVIISISLGLINLFLVNFFPRPSVKISFYGCILLLLCVGLLILVLYDTFWRQVVALKIIVSVICFFLALIIIFMICFYSNQIKLHGIFVSYAVTYLNQNLFVYALIPLYLIFSIGLVALIVWQHCCFSSKFGESKNFFDFNSSGIFGIFNIIQFIWALQFLRDSFNYLLSGMTAHWYWYRKNEFSFSLKRLLTKNWGSVAAGSFINAFFQIPYLIFQLFRCHPDTICSKVGIFCITSCQPFLNLLDLIRTDVYSAINITGFSFCQASKICRNICDQTTLFIGIQSPIKHYRFTTHVFYISACFLIGWMIQRSFMQYYGIWNNGIIIITGLITITWFINIFSDSAEALQTCFLFEHEIEPNYGLKKGLLQIYRQDLEHHEKRMRKDGSC